MLHPWWNLCCHQDQFFLEPLLQGYERQKGSYVGLKSVKEGDRNGCYLRVGGGWPDRQQQSATPVHFPLRLCVSLIPSTLSHGESPSDSKRASLIDFSCSCRLEEQQQWTEQSTLAPTRLHYSFLFSSLPTYPSGPAVPIHHMPMASEIFQGARKQRKAIANGLFGHELYTPGSAKCDLQKGQGIVLLLPRLYQKPCFQWLVQCGSVQYS